MVRASRTIVLGDSWADMLMFLALVSATDQVIATHPSLHLAVLADDVLRLSIGTRDHCVSESAAAVSLMLRCLGDDCSSCFNYQDDYRR